MPLQAAVQVDEAAPDEVWVNLATLQKFLPSPCGDFWELWKNAVGTGIIAYVSQIPDYLGYPDPVPIDEDPTNVYGDPQAHFPDVVAATGREKFVKNFTDVPDVNTYARWKITCTIGWVDTSGGEGGCLEWFPVTNRQMYFQGFQPRLRPKDNSGNWCTPPGPSALDIYNRTYRDGGIQNLPSYTGYPASFPRGPSLLSDFVSAFVLDGSVTIEMLTDPFLEDPQDMPPITVPSGIPEPGPLTGGIDCSLVSPSTIDPFVIASSLEDSDPEALLSINDSLQTVNLAAPETAGQIFPLLTDTQACEYAGLLYAATGVGAVGMEIGDDEDPPNIQKLEGDCGQVTFQLHLPVAGEGEDVQLTSVEITDQDCAQETGKLEPANALLVVPGDNVTNMREIFQRIITKLNQLLQCCPPCNSTHVEANYCITQGEWFKQEGIEKIVIAVKDRVVSTDIRAGNPNIEKLGWFTWLHGPGWLPVQEQWIDYDRQEFRPCNPLISGFAVVPAPGVRLNIAVYLDSVYTIDSTNPQSTRNEDATLDWDKNSCS